MKAIIEKINNEYKLIKCNGSIDIFSAEEVVEYLKSYNDEKHYIFDEYSSDFTEALNQYRENVIISVDDDNRLTFHTDDFFHLYILQNKIDYIEAEEYAQLHGRHKEVIRRYCRNGKIEGTYKEGNTWYIPKNAACPVDGRSTRTVRKKKTSE